MEQSEQEYARQSETKKSGLSKIGGFEDGQSMLSKKVVLDDF
jgi:hypothetical protein